VGVWETRYTDREIDRRTDRLQHERSQHRNKQLHLRQPNVELRRHVMSLVRFTAPGRAGADDEKLFRCSCSPPPARTSATAVQETTWLVWQCCCCCCCHQLHPIPSSRPHPLTFLPASSDRRRYTTTTLRRRRRRRVNLSGTRRRRRRCHGNVKNWLLSAHVPLQRRRRRRRRRRRCRRSVFGVDMWSK